MKTCVICGKTTLVPDHAEGMDICKVCSIKIKMASWYKKSGYTDMSHLQKCKQNALNEFAKANVPEDVAGKFIKVFTSEEENGFIRTIDGNYGQRLSLYRDFFIIETDDYFSYDERLEELKARRRSNMMVKSLKDGFSGALGSQSVTSALVGLVPGGKLVKAGAQLALGAISNASANTTAQIADSDAKLAREVLPDKIIFALGKKLIKYADVSNVEFFDATEDRAGILLFQGNRIKDYMFFFSEGENKAASSICSEITDKINLGYTYTKGIFVTSLDLNYRDRRNTAEKVIDLEKSKDITDPVVKTVYTWINNKRQDSFGARLDLKMNGRDVKAEIWAGFNYDIYGNDKTVSKEDFNYELGTSVNVFLNETTKLSSSLVYISAKQSAYNLKGEDVVAGIRFSKTLLKGLDLYAELKDIVDKDRYEETWNADLNYIKVSSTSQMRRAALLGINYTF